MNINNIFYERKCTEYHIPLYLTDKITRSPETPSASKLFFNMINIQSLLLNLTVLRVLQYIQGKLNYQRGKPIIYLICSVGFFYHLHHVVSGIVQADGELVHSQHFDLQDVVQMPETMFCFEIELGETEGMTGKLLQERTQNLTLESVFKQIAYLDNESNWIVVNGSDLRKSKLKPEVFFFMNLKCFMLRQEVWYSRKEFEFSEEREVLRVYFNEIIFQTIRNGFFMSRIPNTLQLSKINRFFFDKNHLAYTVSQEVYMVRLEDEFSWLKNFNWLKNPFSLLSGNDVDQFIASLASSFREKHNATTLYLPLEEDAFDYAINDTLFELFYNETERSYNEKTANTNYRRLFAINNLKEKHQTTDQANFAFTVIFFHKIVVVTSEHSFLGLVLNVLNCFILWYDVAIPNFPVYIKKFYNQFHLVVKQFKAVCLLVFEILICAKNLLVCFLQIFLNFFKTP